MAASKTEICNMALGHANLIGVISDIEIEQSSGAARCRQWYDTVRRLTLSTFDWSFARKHVELVPHDDVITPAPVPAPAPAPAVPAPPTASASDDFRFGVRYEYPLDCLTIRELRPYAFDDRPIPHKVEIAPDGTRSILSSNFPTSLRYTFDQTQTLAFSPAFDFCLGLALGAYITESATGKTNKRMGLLNEANRAIMLAAETDFNADIDTPEPDAPWIQVRNTFSSGLPGFNPPNVFVLAQNLEAATGSSLVPSV